MRDVNRHPDWWPKVVEVECEGLEEGCTYRQVTQTPFGYQELDVVVDRLEELRELRIRCVNTGTFVDLALTPAGTGTFIDARFGMEPLTARTRIFDAVAGKRYFRRWLEQSLDAMQRVAQRGELGAQRHRREVRARPLDQAATCSPKRCRHQAQPPSAVSDARSCSQSSPWRSR